MNHERISRKAFYKFGGFANPDLFRKANSTGAWTYWRQH